MVVNAAQGIEARDLQCARRNGCREAVFPGGVHAQAVSDPGVRVLRVATDTEGKTAVVFHDLRWLAVTTAGLWDRLDDKATGDTLVSCAMIITTPNDFEPWLSGKAGLELLKPAPNDVLQRWPVSKRVNSSRAPADDQTLIDPFFL